MTHDFAIPVFVAVGQHKKDQSFRVGFGCHWDATLACQRALTELCQIIAIPYRESSVLSQLKTESFLQPKQTLSPKSLAEFPQKEGEEIRDYIFYGVKQAERLGLEVFVVDTTRPDLPIHTAKVIVPGLSHFWPQFGSGFMMSL